MSERNALRKWEKQAAITCALIASCLMGTVATAAPPVALYPKVITPGTELERRFLSRDDGTTVANSVRQVATGQSFSYAFPVSPGDRCRLEVTLSDATAASLPLIQVLGADDKPIPSLAIPRENDKKTNIVSWIVPATWANGSHMQVVFIAREEAFRLEKLRFSARPLDSNGDGLPDVISKMMLQGLPANLAPVVLRPPLRPYTAFQSGHLPDPLIDPFTDAVFAYTAQEEAISGWKQRGYTVWTMGGARAGKEYADAHPDEVQRDSVNKPLIIENDSYYFSPTAGRIAQERSYFDEAIKNGSEGVCPEEPEYFARAGYEGAFKIEWKKLFGSDWQDPASSVTNRWRSGKLMAKLETNHIDSILQPLAADKPEIRRMAALHSPVNYALWKIVAPQFAISDLASVQDVIGQVWTGTARTPVRYAGIRKDRTFAHAYLEYSSLYHLLRGTSKRLWFLTDPLEDDPNRSQTDYKSHYEETLIASLLFPDVNAYEVMPWPERIYGRVPADYATEINTIVAALEEMHNQVGLTGTAMPNSGIGVLLSDTAQWQRESPFASDFDGFFGLTMPLLQAGVPVQVLSLERAEDLSYLRPFKTLLLSYDFQKPANSRVQATLAEWVRQGGSLLFVGGSDDYNEVQDGWWKGAGLASPQEDLWKRLEVNVRGAAVKSSSPSEDKTKYQSVKKGAPAERNLKNKGTYSIDLTPFAKITGSVAVRFSDVSPLDGWGASVDSVQLLIGGKMAAQFACGSDLESRFLTFDNNSQFNGNSRYADNDASWTYQFDNLPKDAQITLKVEMGNGFEVSASSVKPEFGQTLLSVNAGGSLAKTFPRLRITPGYAATIHPIPASSGLPSVLYTLRAGGSPVWTQSVGKGLITNVGVTPGFFTASERSAGLLRTLVQYASQRVGASYKEADVLRLKRGKFTILRTLDESETVEGRTIDILSPNLTVVDDREIPAHSYALLFDIGEDKLPPHIGFVSGKVLAKLETPTITSFFVRGTLGTGGAARLHCGGKRVAGARATDRLGKPVELETIREGDTLLLKYPNDAEGVLIRVGWE